MRDVGARLQVVFAFSFIVLVPAGVFQVQVQIGVVHLLLFSELLLYVRWDGRHALERRRLERLTLRACAGWSFGHIIF